MKDFLLKNIDEHEQDIAKNVDLFVLDNCNYRNLKIGENLVLVLRRSNYGNFIYLGFPFPLESYPIKKFFIHHYNNVIYIINVMNGAIFFQGIVKKFISKKNFYYL